MFKELKDKEGKKEAGETDIECDADGPDKIGLEQVSADAVWISKETDPQIRQGVLIALIAWMAIMFMVAVGGFIKMKNMTAYLTYCRMENDINKELFAQVRNIFSVDIPKNFGLKFDKFVIDTLNNYYEE